MHNVRNDPTTAPLALQAKAAILLNLSGEVASYQGLSEQNISGLNQLIMSSFPPPVDPHQLSVAVTGLDQAIEIFKSSLPPISQAPSLDVAHELLLVHSFTHAATIRLFKNTTAPNKDTKCLKAAFEIVRLITDANVRAMTYVHPALAVSLSSSVVIPRFCD